MKFSEKFKIGWWIILLLTAIVFIYFRKEVIFSENITSFDLGLLVLLFALILVPIFSEITFLGMTVKQKVDEAKLEIKQEIRDQIFNIRSELHNVVSVSNNFNPSIYQNSPSDEALNNMKGELKDSLQIVNKNYGINPAEIPELNIDLNENVVTAFSSRYQIEKEIRRIWEEFFQETPPRRGLMTLVNELVKSEIIPIEIAKSIREVSLVSSPSIHGEPTSADQSDFLKEITPPLLAGLRAIHA